MKIIIGLGNPGFRYRNTRHNAGFLALTVLAEKHRIGIKKKGFNGVYGIGRLSGQEVMLFKPATYMNLSGEAVTAVCSSKLNEENDLLVISDDINLDIGRVRVRERGSAGGHNGLQSIIDKRGSDFARLRIGVGPVEGIEDVPSYVLAPFPRKIRATLEKTLENAASCAETWVVSGIKEAMNRYNIAETS